MHAKRLFYLKRRLDRVPYEPNYRMPQYSPNLSGGQFLAISEELLEIIAEQEHEIEAAREYIAELEAEQEQLNEVITRYYERSLL